MGHALAVDSPSMLKADLPPRPTRPEFQRASWIAMALGLITTLTLAMAVLTPPYSGPWCKEGKGCFEYPYAEIASRFPRDYGWMLPAMLVSLVFVAMLVSIHRCAPAATKGFSLLGLAVGLPGAFILLLDYWVQWAVIQPSIIQGEHDGIALLSQFNPHGVFIALEELGFLLMSAGLFCLVPVFRKLPAPGSAIAWVLAAGFAFCLAALVIISMRFGVEREYVFEIAVITVVWLTLIVVAPLLTVLYRRQMRVVET